MRILILSLNYSPELTGIGKYSGEMAEWLAARGHEVRVVTAPPYYPQWKITDGYANAWSREQLQGARSNGERSVGRNVGRTSVRQQLVGLKPDLRMWRLAGLKSDLRGGRFAGCLSLPFMGSGQAFRLEARLAFGQFCLIQFAGNVAPSFLATGCGVGGRAPFILCSSGVVGRTAFRWQGLAAYSRL